MTTAFKQLVDAQQNFEELYAQQAEANAALRTLPSATVLRKDVEVSLRNYITLVAAMKSVPNWDMLYTDLNEIVKAF